MPKKLTISAGTIILAIAVVATGFWLWPKRFQLEDRYYGQADYHKINTEELQQLVDDENSFALFIYQPDCRASEDFEQKLTNFMNNQQVSLEKIAFSEVKNSGLVQDLKYYPSIAIYRNGKLVDFLRTDADEDIPAYESEAGLAIWWQKYVK